MSNIAPDFKDVQLADIINARCCYSKNYYSNPEITVHSTYAKIYYFYHLTRPGSLIIVFGTFWDPLTLRTQLLVTE